LELFDEVWAPSLFVRDAIAGAVSKPVLHMPLAVDPRLTSFMTRRQLGLPESAFIFLFLFDFSSYWQRKNPFAVLDAFGALVERHPSAPLHLVMKLKGAPPTPAIAEALRSRIAMRESRTQIIDTTMTENEVRNLVREVDCFISLHRSEGFGRGLAEGMALGVPVVGTGYSGSMDFMTGENAWLVSYDLVPVMPDEYPFAEGQVWADPHPASALEMMECVFLDRAGATAKAAVAKRDLARSFSPRAIGLRYSERLAALSRGGQRERQVSRQQQ
jgi:glycosyltransferase involved in cell wall biosynthesis